MNFFEKIKSACQAMAVKRELTLAEEEVKKAEAKLEEKRAKLGITSSSKVKDIGTTAKACKYSRTSDELLVEVNRKSIVKDIRRHLESKVLKAHMIATNDDHFQLLYNHLHHFFSLKHDVTMPYVIERSGKEVHIDFYAKHRTVSVINDDSCKAKLIDCTCRHCR